MPGAVSSARAYPGHYELARDGATIKSVALHCDVLRNQGCYVERIPFADTVIAIVKFACQEKSSCELIENGFRYME